MLKLRISEGVSNFKIRNKKDKEKYKKEEENYEKTNCFYTFSGGQ